MAGSLITGYLIIFTFDCSVGPDSAIIFFWKLWSQAIMRHQIHSNTSLFVFRFNCVERKPSVESPDDAIVDPRLWQQPDMRLPATTLYCWIIHRAGGRVGQRSDSPTRTVRPGQCPTFPAGPTSVRLSDILVPSDFCSTFSVPSFSKNENECWVGKRKKPEKGPKKQESTSSVTQKSQWKTEFVI